MQSLLTLTGKRHMQHHAPTSPTNRCPEQAANSLADAVLSPWVQQADLTLPAGYYGSSVWQGKLNQHPQRISLPPLPLVVFLHGSSGLNEHTRQYQLWLSQALRVATLAPDSFARSHRPCYHSPATTAEYEAVHRLRLIEIQTALAALPQLGWVDQQRLVLAGSSEGAVAVARWRGNEFLGRIIYSWTCEDNYFVDKAENGFDRVCPILNILAERDPFFGASSDFNRGLVVLGDSRHALLGMVNAQMVVLPNAPHTLYNLPASRSHTRHFLHKLLA